MHHIDGDNIVVSRYGDRCHTKFGRGQEHNMGLAISGYGMYLNS